jgi:hypothetical protein
MFLDWRKWIESDIRSQRRMHAGNLFRVGRTPAIPCEYDVIPRGSYSGNLGERRLFLATFNGDFFFRLLLEVAKFSFRFQIRQLLGCVKYLPYPYQLPFPHRYHLLTTAVCNSVSLYDAMHSCNTEEQTVTLYYNRTAPCVSADLCNFINTCRRSFPTQKAPISFLSL